MKHTIKKSYNNSKISLKPHNKIISSSESKLS